MTKVSINKTILRNRYTTYYQIRTITPTYDFFYNFTMFDPEYQMMQDLTSNPKRYAILYKNYNENQRIVELIQAILNNTPYSIKEYTL